MALIDGTRLRLAAETFRSPGALAPATILTTARMTLTPASPDDGPELASLEFDAEVMRFLGPPGLPEDDSAPFLRPRGGEPGIWTARLHSDCSFVGWFALIAAEDRSGTAELGYRLRSADWGRGLATEGATAVLQHGIATMGLTRVRATTMTVNTGSRRVLDKLGFVHVETRHLDWPAPLPGSEKGDMFYELDTRRYREIHSQQ